MQKLFPCDLTFPKYKQGGQGTPEIFKYKLKLKCKM